MTSTILSLDILLLTSPKCTFVLQELCVSILPTFASMVDYSSMKHSIIPRVVALALSSREAPVSQAP